MSHHAFRRSSYVAIILRNCLWIACTIAFEETAFGDEAEREVDSGSALPTPTQIHRLPITVAASCTGSLSKGYSWYLSINSGGQGQLVVSTYPEPTIQEIRIGRRELARIRRTIIETNYFSLKSRQGVIVPSGNVRTVTIVLGQHVKTIETHLVADSASSVIEHGASENERAVRVHNLIRGLFNNSDAAWVGQEAIRGDAER